MTSSVGWAVPTMLCTLVLGTAHPTWCVCALADDPAPSATKELQKVYQADAEDYRFFADTEHQHPLDFVSKPVMHWASPDDWSGDVFVWTHRGRPEFIGCMLSGPRPGGERMIFHEFHALNLSPLPAQKL